jgi:hypothetical protein
MLLTLTREEKAFIAAAIQVKAEAEKEQETVCVSCGERDVSGTSRLFCGLSADCLLVWRLRCVYQYVPGERI